MKKRCYFCGKDMGSKVGHGHVGVFHSLCLDCAYSLRLDQRLPEFISTIADMRRQNSSCRYLNHNRVASATVR